MFDSTLNLTAMCESKSKIEVGVFAIYDAKLTVIKISVKYSVVPSSDFSSECNQLLHI